MTSAHAPRSLLRAVPLLALAASVASAADTWAFEPPADTFAAEALLDLRHLNEQVAGESGFITRSKDGNDFVLGNGKPIRFWAMQDDACRKHEKFPAPDLARHARFLAKRGVNLVRVFGDISSPKSLDEINTGLREDLWRMVAAMKKEGIYVLFVPIWIGASKLKPSLGYLDGGNSNWGGLFYDAKLQAAYKGWLKQTLTVPNPHTGIPLCQDPALAIIQLQNEDSLLFWTFQGIKGEAKAELRRRFFAFVEQKHGSLGKAREAWKDAMPPAGEDKPDDAAGKEAALYKSWELTQHRGGPGQQQRISDQVEWMARTMHDFNRTMGDYVQKDLGCKQLVNAGNWRTADNVTLLDSERWAYSANQVMAVNRYYTGIHTGKNNGWAICVGDQFTDPSVLVRPRELPIAAKQVEGFPMLVTESSWVPPLSHQSEAPMLIAAYQSLNGLDAYFWFASSEETWTKWGIDSANGYLPSQGKWICATPMLMGQWPAAALLYRQGYLRQGEPVVQEQRALADLWQRRMPIIAEDAGYDPNRDQGLIAENSSVRDGVDPLAYQVGPVRVRYDGDPAKSRVTDLVPYIDRSAKTVRANTGELLWDHGRGFCTMDAPKAQGATGFFARVGGVAKLKDVEIRCGNDYATVMAVSVDGKPLASSAKILVQVGTRARSTGWQTKPVEVKVGKSGATVPGEQIVAVGKGPWRIENADVGITIRNPRLTKAQALDANGMPVKDVPLAAAEGGKSLTLPPDVLYVVVQ